MSPSERNMKWVQAPLIGTFKKWKSIFCTVTLKKKKRKKNPLLFFWAKNNSK